MFTICQMPFEAPYEVLYNFPILPKRKLRQEEVNNCPRTQVASEVTIIRCDQNILMILCSLPFVTLCNYIIHLIFECMTNVCFSYWTLSFIKVELRLALFI